MDIFHSILIAFVIVVIHDLLHWGDSAGKSAYRWVRGKVIQKTTIARRDPPVVQ